ncbi:MAG: hypothetical protein GY940_46585, partial [bacterium]|nr:hypothetical protein [bacterium]
MNPLDFMKDTEPGVDARVRMDQIDKGKPEVYISGKELDYKGGDDDSATGGFAASLTTWASIWIASNPGNDATVDKMAQLADIACRNIFGA